MVNEKSVADLHLLIKSNAVVLFRPLVLQYCGRTKTPETSAADAFHLVTQIQYVGGRDKKYLATLIFPGNHGLKELANSQHASSDCDALTGLLDVLQQAIYNRLGNIAVDSDVSERWTSMAKGTVDLKPNHFHD